MLWNSGRDTHIHSVAPDYRTMNTAVITQYVRHTDVAMFFAFTASKKGIMIYVDNGMSHTDFIMLLQSYIQMCSV
jgi:hypothetical protein